MFYPQFLLILEQQFTLEMLIFKYKHKGAWMISSAIENLKYITFLLHYIHYNSKVQYFCKCNLLCLGWLVVSGTLSQARRQLTLTRPMREMLCLCHYLQIRILSSQAVWTVPANSGTCVTTPANRYFLATKQMSTQFV